jgi:hypothetical protein
MQQITQDGAVMNVRRGRHERMNQLAGAIDADVSLHAKIPLVALFRRMHFGITLFPLLLRRAGRSDDRCVNDRAASDLYPALAQMGVDLLKELLPEPIALEQVAKLADRGLVRHQRPAQVDSGEAPHGIDVVQRLFRAGSLRLNHCCKKWIRSINVRSIGGRPASPRG